MKLEQIHHAGVLVADLESSAAFLESALGFERVGVVELSDLIGWFFRSGNVTVELVWIRNAEERQSKLGEKPAVLDHIALEVDALAALTARLRAAGVEVTDPPLITPAYSTVFTLPETSGGVRYQLLEPVPPDG